MAWLFVPGLGGSNSVSEWPVPAFEPSAMWRGKRLPPRYFWRACRKAGLIRLLSGMMLDPSTMQRGAEEFLSSLPAIPANHSPSPEDDEARRTSGISGPSSPMLYIPWARAVVSSRMSPVISVLEWKRSSTTFKTWVTELRQDCSRLLERVAAANGSGFVSWPTPVARDWKGANTSEWGRRKPAKGSGWSLPGMVQESHHALLGLTIVDGNISKRVNPAFAEWLMMSPIGWTDWQR